MAYGKDGYPTELANKVGHVKLIQDPMIQRMIEAFQSSHPATEGTYPPPTGCIDLDGDCPIEQVITVDGGHQAVPNITRPERQIGFVQVAAQMIEMETVDYLRVHRMTDPRDMRKRLGRLVHHTFAALPLVGVRIAGMSVQQSIREGVHRFLSHYELYEALAYLVYRQWQDQLEEPPWMDCLGCGAKLELPRNVLKYRCDDCGEEHTLSDYLMLTENQAEDRSSAETVSSLRAVLETLVLFSFIIKFRDRDKIMNRTLFLLDGPLILRAQLSRLVEPIRALITDQRHKGKPLYLVGVEKSGELRDFANAFAPSLRRPGDFFLPDTRYVVEEIHGRSFSEVTYRNRVNYGAKVIARLGPDHVLVLNLPTGDYVLTPHSQDLIGLEAVVCSLSRLLSYAYENALMPVVLANAEASISNRPSGGLLAQFVTQILDSDVR